MGKRLDVDELVGAAEIARLVGVTVSAVSNWPARHDDFPQPVADLECGPVYYWPNIQNWCEKTGRL